VARRSRGPGSAERHEECRAASGTRVRQLQIRWTAQPSDPLIVAIQKPVVRAGPKAGVRPMWILLLLPFIGLLWVPFYNFQEPALWGFPFFYWYQLAWVPISSVLIWLVYRSRKPDETS
jgi:hypothetical protein